MTSKEGELKPASRCPKCGKRIAEPDHAGSLTFYLFQPFNCSCAGIASGLNKNAQPRRVSFDDTGVEDKAHEFCSECGLQKVSAGGSGSITSFLFQDIRCKCPAKGQKSEGEMAQRFWRLREEDGGRTFDHSRGGRAVGIPDSPSINLRPGAIIGGVYHIIDLIGSGGMGEIYRADQLTLGKTVALKLIPPDRVTEDSWQRFQNEAKSIARLDHINLVKVTDLGVHEGCLPYYAMEYVEGTNLAAVLSKQGTPPLDVVLDVFMQVCDGVDYAHRSGLVHRDLKPANIMVEKTQTGKLQVKILDFGLVKLTRRDREHQSLTSVGDVMGSPFYMSPEQCIGGKIDNRSDIYSIGCTLFETLTLRPPFTGSSPVEIVMGQHSADPPTLASIVGPRAYSESMEVVVAKLLRKNPVERYQTCLELRGDLEKVARGEEVQPFYFSRSKTNQAAGALQATESRAPAGDNPSNRILNPGNLAKAGAFAAAAAVAAAFAIVGPLTHRLFAPKIFPEGQEPVLTMAVPERHSDIPSPPAMVTTPYSTIVDREGKKWRSFSFPKDSSIGEIYEEGGQQRAAQGIVNFPLDQKLAYKPNVEAMKSPGYFKRFRPGDVYEIKMSSVNFLDNMATDKCLGELTVIPGVERLNLLRCDDVTNASAKTIEKFHSLRELDLGPSDLTVDGLAETTALKQLEVFKFYVHQDVGPALKSMQNSTRLRALELSAATTSVSALPYLATFPELDELVIGKLVPNNAESTSLLCRVLGKCQKLRVLSIGDQVLSVKDLKYIASLKNLEQLFFVRVEPTDPATSRESLRLLSQLPKVRRLTVRTFSTDKETLDILRSFKKLEKFTGGGNTVRLRPDTIMTSSLYEH